MHHLRSTLASTFKPAPRPPPPSSSSISPPKAPSALDITRYRYHHGVNLGGIFVLERWLFPSMFPADGKGGDSELDAVAASVRTHGIPQTRSKWQSHWLTALPPSSLTFLTSTASITTIRLPVGYFTLAGGRFCTTGNTLFAPYAAVYEDAWGAVLTLCETLARVGVGVLLDLHALPGGANGEAHSGTSEGRAGMWDADSDGERWRRLARECCCFLAGEVGAGRVKGCVGIQIVNEACWGAGGMGMWEWVEGVVDAMGEVEGFGDAGVPVYVSDAWATGEALEWCQRWNRVSGKKKRACPVGVAVSKYYCFSEVDKAKSPQEIIAQVASSELSEVEDRGRGDVLANGARQVFVTEWSCAFDPASKAKVHEDEREELVKTFGKAQAQRWRVKAGGSWFWTVKMEWMDGGEWGLFDMVKRGAVVPAENLRMDFEHVRSRVEKARAGREESKRSSKEAHIAYWTQAASLTKFEHWRFEQGWDVGFDDALAFFEARASGVISAAKGGGDTIGALELWILKRLRDGGAGGWGAFAWEWEHGFRQGLSAFETRALEL